MTRSVRGEEKARTEKAGCKRKIAKESSKEAGAGTEQDSPDGERCHKGGGGREAERRTKHRNALTQSEESRGRKEKSGGKKERGRE